MNEALPTPRRPPALVRMTGIGKRFGRVTVLEDVDLEICPGEVLVLAGENGAGKSTLIKILGGVHTQFEGAIEVKGRIVHPRSPLEANTLGVTVIYQELSLIASMTVADNVYLGRPLTRCGWVDDRAQQANAQQLLDQLGIPIDVRCRVEDLPTAQQQLVEIAKALAQETEVIVMDEPTSSLSAPEVDKLFGLIDRLKARGCGIVYITHKMEEIQRIADRITVLRDGRRVGTANAADLPPTLLIEWMVGSGATRQVSRQAPVLGRPRLRLEKFTVHSRQTGRRPVVDGVSLTVHAGEIVGIGGLQGSGASELMLGLFGAYSEKPSGEAWLDESPLAITHPRGAIDQGVALLTNDRKATGLVLSLSITANATLASLPGLSPGGWRRPARETAAARSLAESLAIKAASMDLEVSMLSGGNQQKVALAKWLQIRPRLLLLDEPTRGIDVGAKREIYRLINDLTANGISILLITSELPELLALSDRIVVLHRGRVTAQFERDEATATAILNAAMGGANHDTSHA